MILMFDNDMILSLSLYLSSPIDEFDVVLGLIYYSSDDDYDNGKIFRFAKVSFTISQSFLSVIFTVNNRVRLIVLQVIQPMVILLHNI